MTTTTAVRIRPIPAAELDVIRTAGVDASGNPLVRMNDAGGGPLRCCLRDARDGEDVILFGYEPAIPGEGSPYREIGAVFAHAERCAGPDGVGDYPAEWLGRAQVLRAYDDRGWIHPASRTHDGSDPLAALTEVLATPGVVEVHSRNIAYGCFMFAATAG